MTSLGIEDDDMSWVGASLVMCLLIKAVVVLASSDETVAEFMVMLLQSNDLVDVGLEDGDIYSQQYPSFRSASLAEPWLKQTHSMVMLYDT